MGNLAHSILDRLLNMTRQNGWNFTEVLVRYALERLISRVGRSSYSRTLILKGGTMFVVWQKGLVGRPTMDADMEFRGDGTPESLKKIFLEIMAIQMEDAIRFDLESLRVGYIREDDQYGGVRVTTVAYMGNAKIPVQVDVGIGDAITPTARMSEYPLLLRTLPQAKMRMYPPETSVAEKLETLVKRGTENSRMKDFYDLKVLFEMFDFDKAVLQLAVRRTFERRQTPLPVGLPTALTDAFATNVKKLAQWKGFCRKSRIEEIPLPEVLARLADRVSEYELFLSQEN